MKDSHTTEVELEQETGTYPCGDCNVVFDTARGFSDHLIRKGMLVLKCKRAKRVPERS
jgi:hypothetical protein